MLDEASLNRLFYYCQALTGSRADAYDLLHDALEKFLQQKSHDIKQPEAFVRKIARNRFIDLQRRAARTRFEVLEEQPAPESLENELECLIVNETTLQTVWAALNAGEREVVFLWAVEGMTAQQIADELHLSRSAVLVRLKRMRDKVKQRFPAMAGGGRNDV